MSNTKRVLGRGLADLIPLGGSDVRASGATASTLAAGHEIPIQEIQPNPRQPRTHFDETALAELAESIKTNGILQPILVRPRAESSSGDPVRYEIVAGERRYRAALRAGLTRIPAVVRELSDEETLALALIENLIREDIGPIETAHAFRRLMDDFGWTQEEMARRVGKSRPAIANALRLLDLPAHIQESLERAEISEGHARALLGDRKQRDVDGFSERQESAWRRARQGGTVRETEKRMVVGSLESPSRDTALESKSTGGDSPEWISLEDRLRTALGTRVRLTGNFGRGRIEIDFFTEDELETLLERLEQPAILSAAPIAREETLVSNALSQPQLTRPTGRIQGLLTQRRTL